MEKNGARLIVTIGFLILLIQHFCIILVPFILPDLTISVFYLDILGLLIVGIGYILLYSIVQERKGFYLGAGVCFILWVVFSLIWRIITEFYNISFNSSDSGQAWDNFSTNLLNERLLFSFSFIIAGLLLFIGSILIYKAHGGVGTIMLTTFSLLNFIGVILIGAPIYLLPEAQLSNADNLAVGVLVGLFLKIIIVPIIGLISYLILVLKSGDIAK